jgi:hypothetical protein
MPVTRSKQDPETKEVYDSLYWKSKCEKLEESLTPGLVRSLRTQLFSIKKYAEEAKTMDGNDLAENLKLILFCCNLGLGLKSTRSAIPADDSQG